MSISPEAADFLNKLRDDTAHVTFMSQQLQQDLLRRVHKWLDATINLRITIARAQYAQAQLDSLQANPVNHYVAGFLQFHQWLIKERRVLLRMSEVKDTFNIDLSEAFMIDVMDVVRNNATDYDLPQLVLVEDGKDVAIVCCKA